MTILVNGRVIKNQIINKVINDSYSSYKEDTRYPIVVLNIKTDPSLVDVNVHPSKQDIKFSNFEDLKELISNGIENVIKTKLLIPKIEVKEEVPEPTYENLTLNLERNIVSESTSSNDKERLTKLINFDYEPNNELDIEDKEEYIEELPTEKLPELYPVGLVHGTYIVCENEKGIYLIDQHAAQERINYEKFSYLLSHPNKDVIDSIVPIVIELPMQDYIIIKNNIDILEKLNIKVEEFGQSSLRVISHPTWFTKGREEITIRNILEMIKEEEKHFDLAKFLDHLAATMACKASVKGNTRITKEDMESIINQLRECKNPFNCPHGRPTIINFTIYELEKMFKRSV